MSNENGNNENGREIPSNPSSSQPALGQFYQVLEDGRYAFWFDAHTLQTFSQCEQMFYLKNLMFAPQQLHIKGDPRPCISIGSWWSKVSELFYKRMAEKGADTKIFDIMEIAAKAWVMSDMDAGLNSPNPNIREKFEKFAIPVSAGQFGKYFPIPNVPEMLDTLYREKAKKYRTEAEHIAQHCEDTPERQFAINAALSKAREVENQVALPLGPLLMAAQYYQMFAERDARDWKVIAAEAPFGRHGEVVIGETDKVVVYWQGKPDLVIFEESTGVLAPLDQKTKDYIPWNVNTIWKPHNQMAGYIYALSTIASDLGYSNINVDRCILSVCGRLQPATPRKKGDLPKPRFVRVRPTFSRDEIDEWKEGILHKAERVRQCIENETMSGVQWVRNESACHIWSGCEYRGICSRPFASRDIIIKSDYVVQDPWTPFDDED